MTRHVWLVLFVASCALAQRGEREFTAPEGVEWERDVEFARVGKRPLLLDILRPEEPPEGKLPAIIYIHGGGFSKGNKEMGLRDNARLALRGYFTVTIEYRLCGEAIFPAAIEDCKAAVRWIRASADEYGVDPDRIGVWGTSAGGSLSALVGTSGDVKELEGDGGNLDQSSRVTCAIDCFGPSDFLSIEEHRGEGGRHEYGYIGGPFAEHEELARLASARWQVTKDDPPFLIMHGTEDPVVPFAQSEELHEALEEAGVDVTFVPVEGAGHGWGPSDEADARMYAFFDKHLKGKDVEVSSEPIQGKPRGRRPGRK
ncbi:MAG: alpha/beta hydrolase [Planctomycetota bacterium]